MIQWHFAKRNFYTGKVAWNSYLTNGLRHNLRNWPISDWEQSDPHVDYRFLLTRVEKCENWTRIRELFVFNIHTLHKDINVLEIFSKVFSQLIFVLWGKIIYFCSILFVLLSFLSMIKGRRGHDRMVLDLQLPR